MGQQIDQIEIELNRQKSGKTKLGLISTVREAKKTVFTFGEEQVQAVLTIEEVGAVIRGMIRIKLENTPFRENDNLALVEPVTIGMKMTKHPRRMTAMYLHRDWWTRPAFISRFEEMPDRTQSLYLEYEEGAGYLLPMAGTNYKTMAGAGAEGLLTLTMTAYMAGMSELEEPVFYLSYGTDIYEAVSSAFSLAAEEKHVPLKEKKEYPAMFDTLGWCSWDACYTDLSEEIIRAKAEELTKKNVPVRWFLMDDGWLSARGQRLYDLMPEQEKFPNGFKQMIKDIRESSGILRFGVWHAFGGYWGGIEPGSLAAVQEADHVFMSANGKCLPHPSAEKGYGFFRDWYEILRDQGIDFVKVDGQSAIKNYYENTMPVCKAARETHKALEGAAGAYMSGRLINCMGMGMENILGRQGSALSRNSDDFVPDNETGFREHLLQNSYNAIYHDELYYCDWDMFWTYHRDADKHGILRAISGGPIYISDRVGDTLSQAVWPLIYSDGSIIRMDRTAKPSKDCVFQNPELGGLMKLTNIASCGRMKKGGAIAVYHLGQKEESGSVGADDIYDLRGDSFYLYDKRTGAGELICYGERKSIQYGPDDFGLYLFVPYEGQRSYLGLLDKYISFHAIEEIKEKENAVTVVLKESGTFGFFSSKAVNQVLINGVDMTENLEERDGLYRISGKEEGRMLVTIR